MNRSEVKIIYRQFFEDLGARRGAVRERRIIPPPLPRGSAAAARANTSPRTRRRGAASSAREKFSVSPFDRAPGRPRRIRSTSVVPERGNPTKYVSAGVDRAARPPHARSGVNTSGCARACARPRPLVRDDGGDECPPPPRTSETPHRSGRDHPVPCRAHIQGISAPDRRCLAHELASASSST